MLADERRGDLFIGGYADPQMQTLTLVDRGDLRRLSSPVSNFPPSGTGEGNPIPFGWSSLIAATP